MKKTYMKPESTVTIIHMSNAILENSTPYVLIDKDGSVDAGSVDSRRGGSLWDDDED